MLVLNKFLLLLLFMVVIIKCCFCFRSKSFDQYSNGYLDPTIHQYQYQIAENFLFNHVQSLMIRNFEQFRSTINNNLNESFIQSINDRYCLKILNLTLSQPFETEWSAKC